MIQFQVPQFIETEDKIVGPLTLKQFAYIGSFLGAAAVLLFLLDFFLWIFVACILAGIGGMLAFGKYNGRPITIFLKSLFENIWSPSVYVFGPKVQGKKRSVEISPLPRPEIKLTLKMPDFEGLKGLWQKINTTKTAIPHREKPLPSQTEPFGGFSKERYEAVRHITGEREIAKRVDYR